MNSPVNSSTGTLSSTPKNYRKFYWPEAREDGSPKLCGVQERPEVFGWDDSPEPLKLDTKVTTMCARKRLDPTVSPLSSNPRPKPRLAKPIRSSAEISNDLYAINELAKRVMSRTNSTSSSDLEPLLQDDLAETLIACTQQVESTSVCDNPSVNRPAQKSLSSANVPSASSELLKKPSTASIVSPAAIKLLEFSNLRNSTDKSMPNVKNKHPSFNYSPDVSAANVSKHSPVSYSVDVPAPASPLLPNWNKDMVRVSSKLVKRVRAQSDFSTTSSSAGSSPNSSPTRTVDLTDSSSSNTSRSSPIVVYSSTAGVTGSINSSSFSRVNFCQQRPGHPTHTDKAFNKLLKSFREEEDDWLSQVVIAGDSKSASGKSKGGLFKCRSDNQLFSPERNSGFRRTASFHQTDEVGPQPLKKQKSFHVAEPARTGPCSQEQVERKRLEALFRRKQREIEQKKLEAQKRRSEKEKMAVVMRKTVNR